MLAPRARRNKGSKFTKSHRERVESIWIVCLLDLINETFYEADPTEGTEEFNENEVRLDSLHKHMEANNEVKTSKPHAEPEAAQVKAKHAD